MKKYTMPRSFNSLFLELRKKYEIAINPVSDNVKRNHLSVRDTWSKRLSAADSTKNAMHKYQHVNQNFEITFRKIIVKQITDTNVNPSVNIKGGSANMN